MKHLRENNESYLSHLRFAGGIGLSLMLRGIIFLMHGLIPFIEIPKSLNIESTQKKLIMWHEHTQKRLKKQ